MIPGIKKTLKDHMGAGEHPVVRLPASENQATLTVDSETITVPAGSTILQASLSHGVHIPYFCYHPGLSPEGNCRMCLVEIEGSRKLEPSCIMPVRDGMVVHTDSEQVAEARSGVMEFLLLNHPLDCPWCDKAGECMLQDNSFTYGPGTAQHDVIKRTYPVKDFSDKLKMYMDRCIHCTRCVRFLREVEGREEFSLYQRGAQVDVGTYIAHNLSNNYQGCLADVCPVGALVTKPFLYRARVFDLEAQASVCPMCSAGCSIYVDRARNRVARMRPRPNLDVNDWWMCDIGRFEWEWVESDRLETPMRPAPGAAAGEMVPLPWTEALPLAAEALTGTPHGRSALIVSATASCEEAWLVRRLAEHLDAAVSIWYGPGGRVDPAAREDFLRRRDPNPNTTGLERIISPARKDVQPLEALLEGIEKGEVTTLLIAGTTLDEATVLRLGSLEHLVVLSSHRGPAAGAATLALPGAVWLEKTGTFVNGDGHLQRFLQALDSETEARPDAAVLSALLRLVGGGEGYEDTEAVFDEMARSVEGFEGLTWSGIPAGGVRLAEGGSGA